MTFQIAIDGPASSGKGTVARKLARKFGFLCLDTGALYRAITLFFLDYEIDANDPVSYNRALNEIDLTVECIEGVTFVFLNGENVTNRIRDNIVSTNVAMIAKKPEVRVKVREVQKAVGEKSNLVCEGRDTTSVVFPEARFKFYLTASVKARAHRRFLECQSRGEVVSIETLQQQIIERDKLDMTRDECPLVRVKDAIVVDATKIDAYQVGKRIEKIISKELVRCGSIM